MKKAIVLLAVAASLTVTAALADEYVNGYMRSNGTYVAPHYRSSPNSTTQDNYSTKGNINPYTGERGSQPNEDSQNSPYNQHPRGGTYGR